MQESIILRKEDRGEADELVVFFSRELGWLRGIAKNAKKSRIRFGGHLEQFSKVLLTLRPRRRDNLVWIDDSLVTDGFLGIRCDMGKVALAAYLLELTSVFLPEDCPDPRVFDFCADLLTRLNCSKIEPVQAMLDEMELLGLLGYQLSFESCTVCRESFGAGEEAIFSPAKGGAVHRSCLGNDYTGSQLSPDTLGIVRRGLKLGAPATSRLRLHKKGLEELRGALSSFVRYLRGHDMKSLRFLHQVAPWNAE